MPSNGRFVTFGGVQIACLSALSACYLQYINLKSLSWDIWHHGKAHAGPDVKYGTNGKCRTSGKANYDCLDFLTFLFW